MNPRSRSLRFALGLSLALLTGLLFAGTASAHEPLDDGDYQVVLPDGTTIEFTISDTGQTLELTSVPTGYDTEKDDHMTVISNETVRVEITTGEKGEIDVRGLDLVAGSMAFARLPNAAGTVTVVVLGSGIDVLVPDGWTVSDREDEGQNIEVRITDGTVSYELEVDLADGSIEIKRVDSDDDSSDDLEDDQSDDASEDNRSIDDESDDDASSLESTTSTSTSSTTSTTTTTTTIATDDDDSSDDDSSDDASSDDASDDDSGSDD